MNKQKALVLVPHQDDEINILGNVFDRIIKDWEVYVIYSSIDKSAKIGEIRKKEAINACAVWGISQDRILFLDYPDTPNGNGHHFYTDGDKSIEIELEEIIQFFNPGLIIATDFDFHSDHRMLSLAFEHAMGKILRKDDGIKPCVLKGFCYETSYYGMEDYDATGDNRTIQKVNPLSNASYEWGKRISIQSIENERIIWKRKAFKALMCHKSQYAVLHAKSIVNNDNVFWNRRTDNLLYSSKLYASSGDVEKLRDFLIIDTNDIIKKNPRDIDYALSNWNPQAKDAWIKAEWGDRIRFDRIIFHGNPNIEVEKSVDITIYVDGVQVGKVETLNPYGRNTIYKSNVMECNDIRIEFSSIQDDIALSELEVLYGDMNITFDFEKNDENRSNRFLKFYSEFGYIIFSIMIKMRRKLDNILRR